MGKPARSLHRALRRPACWSAQIAAQPERTLCDRVSSVSTIEAGFQITTQDHGDYQSRTVIVATGTTPRMLDHDLAHTNCLAKGLGTQPPRTRISSRANRWR